MLAAAGAVAPVAAAARVPRVVLVVGPVGSLTGEYKSLANAAAAEAVAAGAQVTKIYSPNATWPAVKHALQGASIVVYLGHGNGWPSPYRNSLYPPTQNGFGLNPVAGADDVNHQYFGEASVDNIKLAPNAVVVLSHLCYASGNSEPGLAEGTQSMAIQRVDNYAAGFIRAGAQAVVAEAHLGPAYYIRSLLRSQLSIEQIWRASPNSNGNTMTLASDRSPGFAERLDPDHSSSGFNRSLVSKGLSSVQLRSGATGSSSGTTVSSFVQPPVTPSLTSLGLSIGRVSIKSIPIAAAASQLVLPVASGGAKKMPTGTQVGIRWDPILLDPAPAQSNLTLPPAPPQPSPSTATSASPTTTPSAPPIDPPDVDLVVSEQLGSVVTLNPAVRTGKGLNVGVTYPIRARPVPARRHAPRRDRRRLRRPHPGPRLVGHRAGRRVVHGGLRGAVIDGDDHGLERDPRRPGRERGLRGLGRTVDHAADRLRRPPDLAPNLADRGTPRRDLGLDAGPAGAGARIEGARSHGGGARRDRGGRPFARRAVTGRRVPPPARRRHADARLALDARQHAVARTRVRDRPDRRAVTVARRLNRSQPRSVTRTECRGRPIERPMRPGVVEWAP